MSTPSGDRFSADAPCVATKVRPHGERLRPPPVIRTAALGWIDGKFANPQPITAQGNRRMLGPS